MSIHSSLSKTKRVRRGLVRTPPPKPIKGEVLPVLEVSKLDEARLSSAAARKDQPHGFSVGKRVLFEADGFKGAGVIDDVMHDGSIVWIWPDDGMGRKMLCVADAVVITCEEPVL
ncbi:hypothetical protein [Arthrobacter sp. R4-81]